VTDSASDSVPDLDLVLPNNNAKKKKVRLKRKGRKGRQRGSLKSLDDRWWNCPLSPYTGCASANCLLAVVSTSFVIVFIGMGYFTSTLHSRLILLEHQLRMKIVDDDSRSIPETLQIIQNKLQALQSNQSQVLVNLSDLSKAVTNLQARMDMVNVTVKKEGGEDQIKQSVADLGVKVSEIKQNLEITTNSSHSNTASINMISTELDNLKLNAIDLKNEVVAPPSPVNTPDVSNLSSQLLELNKSLAHQTQKLDTLNSTLLNVAQNSTVMIDWVKQDVVALQGKVSQLQDDNQNVSSRVSSLSEKCASQFLTTLSNMSSLQSVVTSLETRLESLRNQNPLLTTTALPTSPPPGPPPGLDLPSSKSGAAPVSTSDADPDQVKEERKGPRDKREEMSNKVGSSPGEKEIT